MSKLISEMVPQKLGRLPKREFQNLQMLSKKGLQGSSELKETYSVILVIFFENITSLQKSPI